MGDEAAIISGMSAVRSKATDRSSGPNDERCQDVWPGRAEQDGLPRYGRLPWVIRATITLPAIRCWERASSTTSIAPYRAAAGRHLLRGTPRFNAKRFWRLLQDATGAPDEQTVLGIQKTCHRVMRLRWGRSCRTSLSNDAPGMATESSGCALAPR